MAKKPSSWNLYWVESDGIEDCFVAAKNSRSASRLVKKVFRSAFYASIDLALHHWGRPKGIPKKIPTAKQKEEAAFFFEIFTPKDGAI